MRQEKNRAAGIVEPEAQAAIVVASAKKKIVPKKVVKKNDDQDYSNHFNSFYDIFVGMQIDPKNFDLNYVVRETRNMYATFVNLMDTNAVTMKQKFQFEKAPTEFGYRDYGIFPKHALLQMGQGLNEIEAQISSGQRK